MIEKIKLLIQNRLLQHSLFWLFSFYIFLKIIVWQEAIYKIDLIYSLLFHLSLVLAVYIHLYVLIPKFLQPKRYLIYLLSLVFLVCASVILNQWFVDQLGGILFEGYYFISEFSYTQILQFTAAYISISSLLKWSKAWFKISEKERKIRKLEKEKLKVELGVLKAQINPHFLFNSLNNIYSLALDQDQKTPEIVLGLSKCLRYMLYECEEEKVLLKKEIAYLQEYIQLQKLRLEQPTNISFETKGKIDQQVIAPLLFIPIIENGFKHGIKGDVENAFLNIQIEVEEDQLELLAENNKGKATEVEITPHKGLGLKNIKEQLKLLYPKKHLLEIKETDKSFSLRLKLTLS